MDRLVRRYEKLFSIRLTHPLFPHAAQNGGLLKDLIDIKPDPTTLEFFRKHDIHFRWARDLLFCFIRIKEDSESPYFRLPNVLTLRFLFNVHPELRGLTEISDAHGADHIYRFRINLRASANHMDLATADLANVPSREPTRIFNMEEKSWETLTLNLKGYFGVIDLVTEGSSTHRLFTNVDDQTLFYSAANGKENDHLFTIHLGI